MGVTHIAYTTSSGGGRGTSFIAQTFLELDSTKAGLVTPSRRRSQYKKMILLGHRHGGLVYWARWRGRSHILKWIGKWVFHCPDKTVSCSSIAFVQQRTHLVPAGSAATPSRRGSIEAVLIGWLDNTAAEDAKEDMLGFLDAGPLGIDGVRGRTWEETVEPRVLFFNARPATEDPRGGVEARSVDTGLGLAGIALGATGTCSGWEDLSVTRGPLSQGAARPSVVSCRS